MKIILYKQSFYFLKYFFIVLLDFKYIIGEIVLEKKKLGLLSWVIQEIVVLLRLMKIYQYIKF